MIRLFFCAISRGNGWAVRELPLRGIEENRRVDRPEKNRDDKSTKSKA